MIILDIHLMLLSTIFPIAIRHLPISSPCWIATSPRSPEPWSYDLEGRRLVLDSLWINVLKPGGHHSAHIHPHSVVSGTLYLAVPKDASAIKYEDPRLPMLMAAPPRKPSAKDKNKTFVSVAPSPGTLLLWESWLRHEVPVNHAKANRVSVSFNYRLD